MYTQYVHELLTYKHSDTVCVIPMINNKRAHNLPKQATGLLVFTSSRNKRLLKRSDHGACITVTTVYLLLRLSEFTYLLS